MANIKPNMTPARRAWLEQVAADGVCNRRTGKGQHGYACRILGWTEWVFDGRKIVGERITDAGRAARAGQ